MVLLRLFFFLISSIVVADDDARERAASQQAAREALVAVNRAAELLTRTSPDRPVSCDFGQQECSYAQLCQRFAVNRNSEIVYRNSRGETVPNGDLVTVRRAVEQCREGIPQPEENENAEEQPRPSRPSLLGELERRREEIHNLRLAFLRTVRESGDSEAYVRITEAMTADFRDESEDSDDSEPLRPEQVLARFEQQAGARLSPRSRAAYLRYENVLYGIQQNYRRARAAATATPTPTPAPNVNPFQNVEGLTSIEVAGSRENVLANQQRYQARVDQMQQLFANTQRRVLSLLRSRRNSANAAAMDNLIQRIETIEMNVEGSTPDSDCTTPNAYYSRAAHTFTLCGRMMEMPDATIESTIAHELGHAIDPCIAGFPLSTYTGARRTIPEKEEETDQTVPFTPSTRRSGRNFIVNDTEARDNYLNRNRINPRPRILADRVRISENPFLGVLNCLQSESSVAAQRGDTRLGSETIAAFTRSGEMNRLDSEDKRINRDARRVYDSEQEQMSYCGDMSTRTGKSQMQEAFGDWVRTQVTGARVSELAASDPTRAREYATESTLVHIANSCYSTQPDAIAGVRAALWTAGCNDRRSTYEQAFYLATLREGVHPVAYRRIDRVLFANPAVRAALNCQAPQGLEECN